MTLFEDDLDWPPTLMEQEARYGLLFPGLNQFPNTVAADEERCALETPSKSQKSKP